MCFVVAIWSPSIQMSLSAALLSWSLNTSCHMHPGPCMHGLLAFETGLGFTQLLLACFQKGLASLIAP